MVRQLLPIIITAGLLACMKDVTAPPARSVRGRYIANWDFLYYDPGTIVPGDDPPDSFQHLWGMVTCFGNLDITAQSNNAFGGTFQLEIPPDIRCYENARSGFCSLPGVGSVCKAVSGTIADGQVSQGVPWENVATRFRLSIAGVPNALETLTGCTFSAGSDVFVGNFWGDYIAGVDAQGTYDCPGPSGFGRTDIALGITGSRIP